MNSFILNITASSGEFYQGSCASSMRYEDGRKVYTFAKDAILPPLGTEIHVGFL